MNKLNAMEGNISCRREGGKHRTGAKNGKIIFTASSRFLCWFI